MSSLRWKFRRLLAMSPAEVALRASRMLRDRLLPLPHETPQQTWRRHYPSADPLSVLHHLTEWLPLHPDSLPQAERNRLIGEADALLQGKWDLFGYPVQLNDPPRWRSNYLLGKEWTDAPAKQLDYRRIDIAGGAKYVWELSRGQPIVRLASAFAFTGEAHYAHTCLRWLRDWIERNPRDWGIHWTSALEHAIRIFAWTYALRLLSSALTEEDAAIVLGALIQHAEFVERHLSPGSSANNHLIGEAAALAFLGSLLPSSPTARRWQQTGYRILEREALRQFYPDGVNAEQAFGYLPFVWEFYLHAYRLSSIPNAVAARLQRSVDFVRNVMDASGYVPQVGDEDDGTVVPLWSAAANRYRVVGRALAHLLSVEPPPAFGEADDALVWWLWGTTPLQGTRLTECRLYPEGGYAVLHSERWLVLFDSGSLGLGSLAAHGHADALSLWASLDGVPLLIDTGTYAYHEDPDWRNHCRSTPAHNTLTLDDINQSEILGAFLWGKKAQAEFEKVDLASKCVQGSTDAYFPDEVRRRVQLNTTTLQITDEIEPDAASTAVWYWHFHPNWQVEAVEKGVWRVSDGARRCLLHLEGLSEFTATLHWGNETTKLGWYSPRFGHKVPCTTLRVQTSLADAPEDGLAVRWRFQAD